MLNKKLFAKGCRSFVYTGFIGSKKVVMKQERKDIFIKGHLLNEAKWLRILNKKGIGPKLISTGKDFIIYDFVDGLELSKFLEDVKISKRHLKKIVLQVLDKCRIMDSLGVNKFEMHKPLKHILVLGDLKVKLIDFERCRQSKSPKNVTQFCQFLTRGLMGHVFKRVGVKIDKNKLISLLKEYKTGFDKNAYLKVRKLILGSFV